MIYIHNSNIITVTHQREVGGLDYRTTLPFPLSLSLNSSCSWLTHMNRRLRIRNFFFFLFFFSLFFFFFLFSFSFSFYWVTLIYILAASKAAFPMKRDGLLPSLKIVRPPWHMPMTRITMPEHAANHGHQLITY